MSRRSPPSTLTPCLVSATALQFFLRGTSLAQLSEEYDLVKQNITAIETALKNKDRVLPDMKERVREAQKKVESVQAGAALEERLAYCQAESAWSMVIGKEAERDSKVADLKSKRKKARKIAIELEKANADENTLKEELQALEADANAVKEAMKPAQDELKAAIADLKAAKVDLRSIDVSAAEEPTRPVTATQGRADVE